jgi:hypothetical protein
MSRAVRPRPRMCVVIEHSRHDVLLVRVVASERLASLVIVMGHVEAVVMKANSNLWSSKCSSIVVKSDLFHLRSASRVCLLIDTFSVAFLLRTLSITNLCHKTTIYTNSMSLTGKQAREMKGWMGREGIKMS